MQPPRFFLPFLMRLSALLTLLCLVIMILSGLAGRIISSPQIAFTLTNFQDSPEGYTSLYLMDMRTGLHAQASNQPVWCCAVWSRDGTRIAYSGLNDQPFVWDFPDGTTHRLTQSDVYASVLDWSPDSRSILLSVRGENGYALHRVSVDGDELTQLTFLNADIYDADWSPDGRFIVFTARSGVIYQIYRIEANGGNFQQLTQSGDYNISPIFSPDGQRIVYVSGHDDDAELFIMDADGNDVRRLTSGQGSEHSPRWSPDGTRLLFQNFISNGYRWELDTINAIGSQRRQLIDNTAYFNPPAWSPDGQHILYLVQNGNGSELYVVDVAGDHSRLLAQDDFATELNASWQPQP